MDLDWDNLNKSLSGEDQKQNAHDDEEWEYVDEIVEDEQPENAMVGEAIKRIEQAKLYESLLKHDFFAPGSARPEIQNKVTTEIRDFILERLTVLVGIKQQPDEAVSVAPVLPWNERQVEALTSIANRLVNKKEQGAAPINQPVVQPFAGSSPNPVVNVASTPAAPAPTTTKTKKVRRKKKTAEAQPELPANVKIDPLTKLPISDNGVILYKGQVPNKKGVAKRMPTQAEVDMLNNRQVQRSTNGGSVGDKLLGMAITQAQNTNRNISED